MVTRPTKDYLMTRVEAAEYIGVKPETLATWASRQTYNLPYIKCGKSVRYRKSDLDRWLEDRTVSGDV